MWDWAVEGALRCRRSSSYTFEVACVVLHEAAGKHSVLPVPSRAILSSYRFPSRFRRRTGTQILATRRFWWGVGEWQYSCSSKGLYKLSMWWGARANSGTKAGSKTFDLAGSADVSDAGQSPSAPQRRGPVRTLPDTSVGNLASAVVSTDIPTTCSRPNPGTGSLRHSVLGPKDVGMSMLRSIDGALVRADTKVPSPFNRRAVGVSGGYPPETDRQRFSRPGTGRCCCAVNTRPAITAGRKVPRRARWPMRSSPRFSLMRRRWGCGRRGGRWR